MNPEGFSLAIKDWWFQPFQPIQRILYEQWLRYAYSTMITMVEILYNYGFTDVRDGHLRWSFKMAEITTVEQSACLIDCIPIIAAYIPTVRFLSPNLPLLKSKFETTNRQNTED